MAAPLIDISIYENNVIALIDKSPLQLETAETLAGCFTYILNGVFQLQEKQTGYKGWCVDDLCAVTVKESSRKITLFGPVFWLSGGGDCKLFQLDIAKDTTPLLYSIKLNDKNGRQVIYIGKTHNEWVFNS